ncbi:phosphoribosylaminoimidazolesuccinocarboxamide synthase [Ornithinimicrobium cavernae]|uniref:phosphoribosylaminoimidazolesuccinocarboxamide synthase n=1 Tax=Ornithinimicrobium cavernae TaxID=2666047 RepID=UPI000D69ADD9|nr:phosphoribosylaminoimidazolesuccinocarboxamide synthase [Ornithinimicrobium cavernae]
MSAQDTAGLPGELPGFMPVYSGKVRELFAPISPETGLVDESRLLLVASDRISAFDHTIDSPIPDKGAVLTQLSLWWFDQLADLIPNHVLGTDVPDRVAGRAITVRRLRMLPVECIARAYLTGGGLTEYRATGAVSGVPLPPGLEDGSRLPEPVFTPTTKAPAGAHDEPMTFEDVEDELGPALATRVRDLTLGILARGNEIAAERGILIADTKVEYGVDPASLGVTPDEEIDWTTVDPDQVQVILADEVLTPDSSRFWRASEWSPGRTQTSYDKQVLRDWLLSDASGWDRASGESPPPLPAEVVALTRARYVEAYESLTGQPFTSPTEQ